MAEGDDGARRARAIRNAILLALVALAFYAGFIVVQVMRAGGTGAAGVGG